MTFEEIRSIAAGVVQYGFPTIAMVISVLSYLKSRKTDKVKDRLLVIEKKLKSYELEEQEKKKKEASKACIEARIVHQGNQKYKLKIWNSGKAKAYNVDYKLPEGSEDFIIRDKAPFDYLESMKSFEEHVIVCMGSPSKVNITTLWEDENGEKFFKEQIIQVY